MACIFVLSLVFEQSQLSAPSRAPSPRPAMDTSRHGSRFTPPWSTHTPPAIKSGISLTVPWTPWRWGGLFRIEIYRTTSRATADDRVVSTYFSLNASAHGFTNMPKQISELVSPLYRPVKFVSNWSSFKLFLKKWWCNSWSLRQWPWLFFATDGWGITKRLLRLYSSCQDWIWCCVYFFSSTWLHWVLILISYRFSKNYNLWYFFHLRRAGPGHRRRLRWTRWWFWGARPDRGVRLSPASLRPGFILPFLFETWS